MPVSSDHPTIVPRGLPLSYLIQPRRLVLMKRLGYLPRASQDLSYDLEGCREREREKEEGDPEEAEAAERASHSSGPTVREKDKKDPRGESKLIRSKILPGPTLNTRA